MGTRYPAWYPSRLTESDPTTTSESLKTDVSCVTRPTHVLQDDLRLGAFAGDQPSLTSSDDFGSRRKEAGPKPRSPTQVPPRFRPGRIQSEIASVAPSRSGLLC